MPFERGRSGNPAGAPVGSRHRQQLNGEFIAALLRDFRQGGPKAIERVRRTQPAAYLKILALLMPREHKVEHRNLVTNLTDEELDAAIEFIQKMLATQVENAKVIEGTTAPTALPAPTELEQPGGKPQSTPRTCGHRDWSEWARQAQASVRSCDQPIRNDACANPAR